MTSQKMPPHTQFEHKIWLIQLRHRLRVEVDVPLLFKRFLVRK